MNSSIANNYYSHMNSYKLIEQEILSSVNNDLIKAKELLNSNRQYLDELFTANLYSYLFKILAGFISEIFMLYIIR